MGIGVNIAFTPYTYDLVIRDNLPWHSVPLCFFCSFESMLFMLY